VIIATNVVPDATSQPPAGTGDVLVVFQRSGGIAGIHETLTVYTSGVLELNQRILNGSKEHEVPPSALADLRTLLNSPEFAGLESHYTAPGVDLITYAVIVPGAGKERTIVTMDGAKNPPVLQQVLEELEQLRAQMK
jgi:hypothetical protein